MSESKRIPGLWWLSNDPDKQAGGDLILEDRKLELNGSFEGLKPGVFGGGPTLVTVEQNSTIQGITRKGGIKYTLEYFSEPISFTMHSYKADTYSLGDVFMGEHFEATDKLAFDRYYVEFPYLLEWVNDGVLSIQTSFKQSEPPQFQQSTITIGELKTFELFKNKQFKLALIVKPGSIPISTPREAINITQHCYLEIESIKGTLLLSEARSIIKHFERFLIIATNRSLEPIKIEAKTNKSKTPGYVTIFPHNLKEKEYKDLSIHQMNFSFDEVKADCQTIFEKWFSDREKFVDIYDLFSSLRSDIPKNLNNQYKDVLSAIEGYIRIESGNYDIELDKAIKTINEKLPKDGRPLVKGDYDKVRITRNKLTHVAVKAKDEKYVYSDVDVWHSYRKLLFLLEYTFLKNLGVGESLLEKFSNKRKYR